MLLNKEILLGLYGGARKTIEFNLSWNTGNTQITAYAPSQNENDRPRINTWRSDGTNVIYLSAGTGIQKLSSTNFFQPSPWGNRQTGSQKIDITLSGSLTAGVDIFTDTFLPAPTLSPATGWKVITTFDPPVPGQVQYQYTVTRASSAIQNISITFN